MGALLSIVSENNPWASFHVNIIGTYNGSVVALRKMTAQGHGKIINLLGMGDTGAVKYQTAYTSSKVWVRNFTKTLANEYKHSGVDVFGFNPGLVKTEMLSDVHAINGFEDKMNPLRFIVLLWGNETDVPAKKALWLASPATDGKNGLLVTVLTIWFMISRLITVPFGLLFKKPNELMELNITSIEPIISSD